MPDIYLRTVPSDADSDDVRLYDPTVADAGGTINATAAQTLDNVTQAATAQVIISATASQTIDAVTQSVNADLLVQATATQTLDAVTQSVNADLLVQATAAQTLDNVTQSATAQVTINASANQTIDGVTQAVTATISQPDGAVTPRGDDADPRKKKPIVTIRPKVERDLDDILELVETVSETRRVTANRATIKEAIAAIKTVEAPQNYKPAIASIQKALTKVSRATAKHEGLQAAMVRISIDLETLIADMERKRKRRRREEEEIILWMALT